MKKRIITVVILVLTATAIWTLGVRPDGGQETPFTFAVLTRGDLENLVSGTGTLTAVGTVEVGTQVSGVIDHLYADFNDRVEVGQLLAVLDTAALAASVRDFQAGVARTKAQYNQALDEYERHVPLAEKGYLSELEIRALATQVETAHATLQSAEAALQRARTNLQHAEIRAPIKGTVIQRNVEAGQTVAASLAAPTLFIIAEDLAQMEILALVDESDIGQIRETQEVRFSVQAYPDENFTGWVRQIHLQPQTIQNVVNYTVVVDAPNGEGLLLPGMTASVDFVVEHVEDVLLVPAVALRFQPTQEMRVAFVERQRERMDALPDSAHQQTRERLVGRQQPFGGIQQRQMPDDVGRVWYLDENGDPGMTLVRTGATDGLMTEIKTGERPGGRGLSFTFLEGMQVITGTTSSSTSQKSPTTLNSQPRMGSRKGPPGLF